MNKKTKTLSKDAMLRNIGGLSLGDRAYCGPYGTVTCTKAAYSFNAKGLMPKRIRGARRCKVTGSKKIANGGNYTMASLRKAICG